MGVITCRLSGVGGCSALCLALETDNMEKFEHVIEKEKREPEDDDSNDEFAEIETAATFWVH
jgi:hypothetical protein